MNSDMSNKLNYYEKKVGNIKDANIKANNILIKNGLIIDPDKDREFRSDIFIKEGIVEEIKENIEVEGLKSLIVIDAKDYLVCPGFIDMHVHLREPGDEDEEDMASAVEAAKRGGITSIVAMPNTKPPIDNINMVEYIINKSHRIGYKVYPVASMTKKIEGKEISELGLLSDAGAIAFSDDGNCVNDSKLMYEIMRYASRLGLLLILHEEDYSFSKHGCANEGYFSFLLGLGGISTLSEEVMVARDILLAKRTGARIHITHVSSRNSVEMIKKAKEEGLKVTCDVTPHHLFFNDSCLLSYNTSFKVKPPIRSEEDRIALVSGIKEGIIDAIASDHAPHLEIEKNTTFGEASFGAIGLETMFKVCFTKLFVEEKIKLSKVVSLLTSAPAKILNIEEGSIKIGKSANITIIDPNKSGILRKEDIVSKSKNSPFMGKNLYGEIIYTISEGRLVFENKDFAVTCNVTCNNTGT